MLSYEAYGNNSIISVILYMRINIYLYHPHEPLFMIGLHHIIFVVYIQLQGHITPPCFKLKAYIYFSQHYVI